MESNSLCPCSQSEQNQIPGPNATVVQSDTTLPSANYVHPSTFDANTFKVLGWQVRFTPKHCVSSPHWSLESRNLLCQTWNHWHWLDHRQPKRHEPPDATTDNCDRISSGSPADCLPPVAQTCISLLRHVQTVMQANIRPQ